MRLIFRVGGSEIESSEKSKLDNDIAVLTKTLTLNVELGFNSITKEFDEKKVNTYLTKGVITVYLVSANGTNMAGLHTLNVGEILNEGNNISRTVGL